METAQPSASGAEKELITNSIGMKLKLIPAGSFLMGATPDDTGAYKDEKPQHKVTITRPFYLGVYEVTQYEYRQMMGENPSSFKDSELLPVEQVSWLDAVKFCNKLSERERRKPYYKIEEEAVTVLGGNGYRLPTEAEWEYACRAPQNPEEAMEHPFGNHDTGLEDYAWFEQALRGKDAPGRAEEAQPLGPVRYAGQRVGVVPGLAIRKCTINDRLDADPPGPASAPLRVYRGGGWGIGARNCRPAFRSSSAPDDRISDLGFRLAAVQE